MRVTRERFPALSGISPDGRPSAALYHPRGLSCAQRLRICPESFLSSVSGETRPSANARLPRPERCRFRAGALPFSRPSDRRHGYHLTRNERARGLAPHARAQAGQALPECGGSPSNWLSAMRQRTRVPQTGSRRANADAAAQESEFLCVQIRALIAHPFGTASLDRIRRPGKLPGLVILRLVGPILRIDSQVRN